MNTPPDPPAWRDRSRCGFALALALIALGPLVALYSGLGSTPDTRTSANNRPREAPALEGFRQVGQALIGTIETSDGKRLTLVLDARTRAVIGSRLETVESAR
jgi:hypothetical protein